MVEVEGLTYDGKSTKVPLVILKPSVMPSVSKCQVFLSLFLNGQKKRSRSSCCLDADSLLTVVIFSPRPFQPLLVQMSLGGFEITPPVTFRLQSGSGPVHISGQHFVRKFLGQRLVIPLLS